MGLLGELKQLILGSSRMPLTLDYREFLVVMEMI